jgi:type II secretory pathway predicted ATPase ExeA
MKLREMLSYYSLSSMPFTKELATEQLMRLPSVERHLASAHLLVDTRGIGLITGKAGTGKSCLLRLLADSLPTGIYKPFYICHSSVGTVEFYTHLVDAFGIEPCYRRARMFRDFKRQVISMNNSAHVHPVLLIDEAHMLNNDILGEIRLLTNYQIDSLNALTVILCGAETLTRKFGLSSLEALANSITITINLDGLPEEETFAYIEGRLSSCGAKAVVFTHGALTLIHQASAGIMRTIGTIANAALMKAFIAKSKQVEAEHVQAVLQR